VSTVRRRPALIANAKQALADLGPTIARVRDLRGLTGPQIEKLTDYSIDRSALSRLESGRRLDPHVSTLLVLAVALDCDFFISRRGHIEVRGTNLNERPPKEKT
jgi:transcriptional regulator with XRE-family HTH domain